MNSKRIRNKIIEEQFNISNMDFGRKPKINNNIFNKKPFPDQHIYDMILNSEKIDRSVINDLNDKISTAYANNKNELAKII